MPATADAPIGFDLSDIEFWAQPLAERERAFEALRNLSGHRYWAEPDTRAVGIEPGPGYWSITRHEEICEVSRRPEVFCSGQGATSIADTPEYFLEYFGSMINLDDPRHARMRRIVSGAFTPGMLRKVEADIARAAAEIVGEVRAAGGGDFVTDVAARLPLKVICDMMGIPPSEYDTVFTRSNVIIGNADEEYVPQADPMQVIGALMNAGADLHALMSELAQHRRGNPTDDLTSALVNASVDGESLTDAELGSFFILLVVAGNETTRNAIAHGLDLLRANPGERARWQADLEAMTPGAVDEIVRVASPVVWMRRTATADVELAGTRISSGDKLILYYWSANRDAAVFDDPYRFDIGRQPNPHVGFGGPGPHFCLGAHLARREIGVMYRELLRAVPTIEAVGEPMRLRSSFINGIKHLDYRVA